MRVQLAALAGLVAACGECETAERALAPCGDCSIGEVRRGRFLDDEALEVASSTAGTVVREDCGGGLRVLGGDLAPRRALAIAYDYHDAQGIQAIAVDLDGSVAAITFELEYIGDIDERVATRLHLFDAGGARRWSITVATDDLGSDWRQLALGPDQVFLGGSHGRLRAFDRATGAPAWKHGFSTVRDAAVAARPTGGAVAIDPTAAGGLIGFAADGSIEWTVVPAALGVAELSAVAVAPDGAIAVLGDDGELTPESAQRLVLLAPDHSVRWSQPFDQRFSTRVGSMATDGERIIVAGDYTGTLAIDPSVPPSIETDGFVAAVGAAGIETTGTAGGAGTQRAHVASLTAETAIYAITSYGPYAPPELVLGAATAAGNGLAILEVAR
jgi:hypothetical protein